MHGDGCFPFVALLCSACAACREETLRRLPGARVPAGLTWTQPSSSPGRVCRASGEYKVSAMLLLGRPISVTHARGWMRRDGQAPGEFFCDLAPKTAVLGGAAASPLRSSLVWLADPTRAVVNVTSSSLAYKAYTSTDAPCTTRLQQKVCRTACRDARESHQRALPVCSWTSCTCRGAGPVFTTRLRRPAAHSTSKHVHALVRKNDMAADVRIRVHLYSVRTPTP